MTRPRCAKWSRSLQANRANLEGLSRNYETIISVAKDRENLEAFKGVLGPYLLAQEEILKLSANNKNKRPGHCKTASSIRNSRRSAPRSSQSWTKTSYDADKAGQRIMGEVATAKTVILGSLAVALLLAYACGYFLLQSITRPLGRLVSATEAISTGRLHPPDGPGPARRIRHFGAGIQSHDRGADGAGRPGAEVRHPGQHLGDGDRRHRPRSSRRPPARSPRRRPRSAPPPRRSPPPPRNWSRP